ncbi:MAG: hypothetical protein R6V10_03125 [bacterium]
MKKGQKWGALLAGAWIAILLGAGIYTVHIPYRVEAGDLKGFGPIMQSDDPHFVKDQILARKISRITRGMKDDWGALNAKYDKLPPFEVPNNDRITEGQLERYITAVQSYAKEFEEFNRRTMQGNPGFFRMLATVGMIKTYHKVVKRRSLVKARMREEEFNWVRDRLIEVILYCVNYKLQHDKDMEDRHKVLIQRIQDRCYRILDLKEQVGDNEFVIRHERYHPERIPLSNFRLFLNNYKQVRYSGINFNEPVEINFDKEGILNSLTRNSP